MNGLFTAFRNCSPLVVMAGQQVRSMLPTDPYLYADQSTQFPRPYVKWALEPARAQDVPLALARAWHIAAHGRRGPPSSRSRWTTGVPRARRCPWARSPIALHRCPGPVELSVRLGSVAR